MAACRKHNLMALRQVCRECPWLCTKLDRFAGARGAIDGRTCKAVNAKARHFPQAKRTHLLQQLDQRVAGSRKARDGQANQAEAGTPGGAVAEN